MPTETELKLAIRPEDQRRISRLAVIRHHASKRATRKRVLSVYYDTTDRDLSGRGMILRLRKHGGQWLQTVKAAQQAVGGLHQRAEYEMPVRGAKLDYAKLAKLEGLTMFGDAAFTSRLQPVFETDFRRTAWQLEFPDGSQVELALDLGEVRSDDRQTDISELELELKHGQPHVLYTIANELAGSVDIRLSNISKAELGYRVANPAPLLPTKGAEVRLSKGMDLEQAFTAILWNGLAQVQSNIAVILGSDHAEGVHQMRVGLRRFRSTLAVFRKYIPRSATKPIREDLRLLGEPLGPARDWDVFTQDYLPPMPKSGSAERFVGSVHAEADKRRQSAYQSLRGTLASREYHHSMLRIASWVACSDWKTVMEPEELRRLASPAKSKSGRILTRGHRNLLKLAKTLDRSDEEQLHTLRIAIKTQRYATEFFLSLHPGKGLDNYRQALRALQSALGHLNDESTARRLLSELEEVADAPEAKDLRKAWRKRSRAERSKLEKLLNPIRKQKLPWK